MQWKMVIHLPFFRTFHTIAINYQNQVQWHNGVKSFMNKFITIHCKYSGKLDTVKKLYFDTTATSEVKQLYLYGYSTLLGAGSGIPYHFTFAAFNWIVCSVLECSFSLCPIFHCTTTVYICSVWVHVFFELYNKVDCFSSQDSVSQIIILEEFRKNLTIT